MSQNYPVRDLRGPSDPVQVLHAVVSGGTTTADEAEIQIGTITSGTKQRQVLLRLTIANNTGASARVQIRAGTAGTILGVYVVPDGVTQSFFDQLTGATAGFLTREVLDAVSSGTLWIGFALVTENVPS